MRTSKLPPEIREWIEARTLENVARFYRDALTHIRDRGTLPPDSEGKLGLKLRRDGLICFEYSSRKGRSVHLTPLAEKLLEAIP